MNAKNRERYQLPNGALVYETSRERRPNGNSTYWIVETKREGTCPSRDLTPVATLPCDMGCEHDEAIQRQIDKLKARVAELEAALAELVACNELDFDNHGAVNLKAAARASRAQSAARALLANPSTQGGNAMTLIERARTRRDELRSVIQSGNYFTGCAHAYRESLAALEWAIEAIDPCPDATSQLIEVAWQAHQQAALNCLTAMLQEAQHG